MGTFFVIFCHPVLSQLTDFVQGFEDIHFENFRPVSPVESFNKGILRRLSRFNEFQSDTMLLGPTSQSDGDEFRTVVHT